MSPAPSFRAPQEPPAMMWTAQTRTRAQSRDVAKQKAHDDVVMIAMNTRTRSAGLRRLRRGRIGVDLRRQTVEVV